MDQRELQPKAMGTERAAKEPVRAIELPADGSQQTADPQQVSSAVSRKMPRLAVLEGLRGLAAVYVLCHHVLGKYLGSHWYTLPFALGQEAVILFFLVSGFVIYFSVQSSRDKRFRPYIVRRSRRIYPTFLLALLLGGLASWWANLQAPEQSWTTLLGNLLMLQDFQFVKPGAYFGQYGSNIPLWSLSYEWWFYLLFWPVYKFVPIHQRAAGAFLIGSAGMLLYCAVPTGAGLFLMYFPLWWCGVELAREYLETGTITLRRQAKYTAGLLAMMAAWAAIQYGLLHRPMTTPGVTPFVQLRHFGAGVAFLAIGLLSTRYCNRQIVIAMLKPFILIAPISYALYALHWPLIMTLGPALDWPEPFKIIVLLTVVVMLAWLVEVPGQRLINKLTTRFA